MVSEPADLELDRGEEKIRNLCTYTLTVSIFPVHDKLHKINENSYEQKVIPIGQKYRAPAQKKNPSIEFRVGLGHKSMLLWRVVR